MTDEAELSALASAPPHNAHFTSALERTLQRLSRCVPLVLERPETMALAARWFPQLAPAFAADSMPRKNVGRARRCPLSPSARQVLEELAAGERLIYDAAVQRAEFMLAAAAADNV